MPYNILYALQALQNYLAKNNTSQSSDNCNCNNQPASSTHPPTPTFHMRKALDMMVWNNKNSLVCVVYTTALPFFFFQFLPIKMEPANIKKHGMK